MSTEAKEEKTAPAPTSSKVPLVLLLVSVLNLAATGFVANTVWSIPIEEESTATDGDAAEEPEAPAEGEHEGEAKGEGKPAGSDRVVSLEPFVVNLNEPGSNRYLKAVFEVEMSNSHAVGDLNGAKRNVRDEIFHYLSSLSVADTLGEQNKARIQREVLSCIEREIGKDHVKRLFFTEFVVQ